MLVTLLKADVYRGTVAISYASFVTGFPEVAITIQTRGRSLVWDVHLERPGCPVPPVIGLLSTTLVGGSRKCDSACRLSILQCSFPCDISGILIFPSINTEENSFHSVKTLKRRKYLIK